jgi:choline dehydrogenase-like flavoprotein
MFMEAMFEKGLPQYDDMFSSRDAVIGCGHTLRTVHDGIRVASTDYLRNSRKQSNLTIKTLTVVDKILLDGKIDALTAVAIKVLDVESRKTSTIRASKEIIVSGSAYCSPAVLMRSGIGAKEELDQLGIVCQVNSPGVGKNLMDRPVSLNDWGFSAAG